ncbi:hypothetical protein [Streptosporangium sandarakinum]|uniref:hypothetical protein n=1 Tax=Streptosporangium sandarakinum TaxID=1260955 RepID=UPI003715AC31
MKPPVCRHAGPRLRLAGGRAHLLPALTPPNGMVPAWFSMLSPGTEYRHLQATTAGCEVRDAGYVTLAFRPGGGWLLAAVPHGAAFDPAGPVLAAPPGADVRAAALARFQQMAVLGLDRLPSGTCVDGAVVVGSGPVALGCALELRRRGASSVRIITSRTGAPIEAVPGVSCLAGLEAPAALVIDAAGRPERAAALLAPGGVLALLGTPPSEAGLSALQVHRSGWTVIGMHELTSDADVYHAAYTTAVSWLTDQVGSRLLNIWCQIVPGTSAPAVYDTLARPAGRDPHPVVIFSWGVP